MSRRQSLDSDKKSVESASTNLYRRILDASGAYMYQLDTNGRIVDVNAAFLELLGYPRDRMIGKEVWRFVRKNDQKYVRTMVLGTVHGNPITEFSALTFVRNDDEESVIPVRVDVHPVATHEQHGPGIISIVTDARTGSLFMQLLEEETLSTGVTYGLPVTIHRKDLEGRFTHPDPHFYGKTDFDLFKKRLAEKYRRDDREVIKSGKPWEAIEQHSDDRKVHVVKIPERDDSGAVCGLRIIFWNVEDSQRVLAGLVRAKERLYSSLINNIPFVIYRKDIGLKFTFVSDRYCEHVGRMRSEVLGKTDQDLFPEFADKYEADDRVVLRNGETMETDERHKPPGGIEMVVHVVKTPIFDDAGEIVGLQGVYWDVTAEYRARDLERDRHEIELERTAAKRTIEEVQHRVKNNLQVVTSLLRMQRNRSQTEETRAALNDSVNRVFAAASLHEHLYKLLESGQHAPTDPINAADYIDDVAQEVFKSFESASGHVSLQLELDAVSLQIPQATPCAIILAEVISNALKHAFPNGRSGVVNVSLQMADSANARLSVADDGVGISPDQKFPTPNSLGLKIVNGLTQQLGGKASIVPSHPGTAFTLDFPTLVSASSSP